MIWVVIQNMTVDSCASLVLAVCSKTCKGLESSGAHGAPANTGLSPAGHKESLEFSTIGVQHLRLVVPACCRQLLRHACQVVKLAMHFGYQGRQLPWSRRYEVPNSTSRNTQFPNSTHQPWSWALQYSSQLTCLSRETRSPRLPMFWSFCLSRDSGSTLEDAAWPCRWQ